MLEYQYQWRGDKSDIIFLPLLFSKNFLMIRKSFEQGSISKLNHKGILHFSYHSVNYFYQVMIQIIDYLKGVPSKWLTIYD